MTSNGGIVRERRNPGRLPKQGRFRGLDRQLYRALKC